jgi:hypothetical protein
MDALRPCLFGIEPSRCEICAEFTELFFDVAACKLAAGSRDGVGELCSDLRFRSQYLEPNPGTIEHWREEHHFYKPDIDRRVLFLCESPKNQLPRNDLGGNKCYETRRFAYDAGAGNVISGLRSWDRQNKRAEVFLAARTPARESFVNYDFESGRYHGMFGDIGLQNCVITNVVLCAPLSGPKPKALVGHCAGTFLTRLLRVVKPLTVVALGGDTADWYAQYRGRWNPQAPEAVEIFHYSVRPKDVPRRYESWSSAAAKLRRSLPQEPLWLHESH